MESPFCPEMGTHLPSTLSARHTDRMDSGFCGERQGQEIDGAANSAGTQSATSLGHRLLSQLAKSFHYATNVVQPSNSKILSGSSRSFPRPSLPREACPSIQGNPARDALGPAVCVQVDGIFAISALDVIYQ
ncbi:MAG TPA: hypothetical protein VM715_02095, partial [Candidatus Acidoferrum sp.]|nr:hypothetical protein [Candidatus Acidoferrum sp.]